MAENLLLKWAAEQDGQAEDDKLDALVEEEKDVLPEHWRLEQSTSTRKYLQSTSLPFSHFMVVEHLP